MYGGTQTSMLQLAKDVGVVDESMQSFSDMTFEQTIESIHKLQEQLGITGNAQKEASKTIQGSMAMTKAAWENLLTALANPEEDITEPIQNLITAIVGENEGEGLINQIIPAIETTFEGIGTLIERLVPELLDRMPILLDENLPKLIDSAFNILQSIVDSLTQNADKIGVFVNTLIQRTVEFITQNLPIILGAGMTILVEIIKGIAKAMPQLVPAIITCITTIATTLTDPQVLGDIIIAAFDIVLAIVDGIVDNIDEVVDAIILVTENIRDALLRPDVLAKIISASFELLLQVILGIGKAAPEIIRAVVELAANLADGFFKTDWLQLGKDIINGLWQGIQNVWNSFTGWWSSGWDSLVGGIKKLLGIHSPSRVFASIGENMALGLSDGWGNEFKDVKKDIENGMDFDANATISTNGKYSSSAGSLSPINLSLNIENFYNNTDKDIESLADSLMVVINDKMIRQGVAYA